MSRKFHLSRRKFMQLSALITMAPLSSQAIENSKSQSSIDKKLTEPWLTINAVQEHMFPAGKNSPGAKDLHALDYLRSMINSPDVSEADRKFIKSGSGWLDDLTKAQYSASFIDLDADTREKALRKIEDSKAGRRWLSLLLTYLIEALLADPVYGGNPDGIGWRWLQHQAGFPTPPEDKKYFMLGKPKQRFTKS